MAAKPETVFIASVHRHLPPSTELYRMKNHNEFNGGIADCWYSGYGGDLWIEYKFIVVPKRDTTMIDFIGGKNPMFSGLQQEWLRDRHIEGRNVWAIVGCKEGGVLFKNRGWEQAMSTSAFKASLQTRVELANLITMETGP